MQIGNDEIGLGLLIASPHALYDVALDKGEEGVKNSPKIRTSFIDVPLGSPSLIRNTLVTFGSIFRLEMMKLS